MSSLITLLRTALQCVVVASALVVVVAAQTPPPTAPTAPAAAPRPAAPEPVPVRVDVTLSRHLADKRVSNLPFTMLGQVGGRASVRIGSSVPISDGSKITYQSVGTNIDAIIHSSSEAGRFRLKLRLEDSSVAESSARATQPNLEAAPIVRSNSFNANVTVRDGQPTELVVASDKLSGETIKVEVRVTTIK